MQQRYYDPTSGRFLSIDPLETSPSDPRTINRYTYAANNPYTYVDPDGRAFGDPERSDDMWPDDLDWSDPGGFDWGRNRVSRLSHSLDSDQDIVLGLSLIHI